MMQADVQLLKAIGADTSALREGPWKEGLDYLERAAVPGREYGYWRSDIEEARKCFVKAKSLGPSSDKDRLREAQAEYWVGTCSRYLGDDVGASPAFAQVEPFVTHALERDVDRARELDQRRYRYHMVPLGVPRPLSSGPVRKTFASL